VASLLTTIARTSDIPCRRGDHEFAIVLPNTPSGGADHVRARLRREAGGTLARSGQTTFSVGVVEWSPNESYQALDARASASLVRLAAATETEPPPASFVERSRRRPWSTQEDVAAASSTRDVVVGVLAEDIAASRRENDPLALVAIDVDSFGQLGQTLGTERAERLLDDLERLLGRTVGRGSVHRIGPDEFAVILPASTVDDAEGLLGVVQEALGEESARGVRITLSAGITELTDSDDARLALGRAEHALWQAKQAGRGTVVIALTNSP
jgi:diguanylate cyclase (GGDEF)-like protein